MYAATYMVWSEGWLPASLIPDVPLATLIYDIPTINVTSLEKELVPEGPC